MDGREDDTSEEDHGLDTAFAGHYEDTEPEEESLVVSLEISEECEQSISSSRSRGEFDENMSGERSVTPPSFPSSRSLRRERTMTSYHRGLSRYGNDESDGNSEGESNGGQLTLGDEGITDEEAAEETVIETSCDEASFNTSICSYKETGSSSELSVDPVVWKKFKFLSSILKETQHNLRAMDNLILEHRRLQDQSSALPQPSHALHQGLGEGEAKTDEAKLEEILSLLHHLTQTLSSYEQHPLLASAPHVQVIGTSIHPVGAAHPHQVLSSLWPEGNVRDANITLHHTPLEVPVPLSLSPHPQPYLPPPQPLSPPKDAKPESQGRNVSAAAKEGNTYSLYVTPDPSDPRASQPHQESPRKMPSSPSPRTALNNISGSLSAAEVHKRDTISQTDPFLLVPRASEEHPSPRLNTPSYQGCQAEGHRSQEVLHHPLMKETTSLRKEIDGIMARKQALDSRLQSLIAHRAMQREMDTLQSEQPKKRLTPLTKSKSLEDGELRRSRSRHSRCKARSKSYEEESHSRRKNNTQETYLSMINENQDEFPSLTMESLENEDRITELQTDEADIPGLGDSGLSSEINSINATIQELVRENQQLHKFLQGMTIESLLKVDQEKVALEAKLQSLDKENQSLKISIDEDENTDHGKPRTPKGVKFCIQEAGEEVTESDERTEAKRRKPETYDQEQTPEVPKSPKASGITHIKEETAGEVMSTVSEALEEASQSSSHQTDTISSLRGEIERLTRQNQQLVNIIEKERHVGSSHKDSPRTAKTTSEDVSVSSVGESLTEHGNTTKEMEKLQHKIKKLNDERQALELKLSNEASERDFECTRLEARIQILSDLNQTLTQKLQDSKEQNKAKAETSCQTDTLDAKPTHITEHERDKEKEQTAAPHHIPPSSDKPPAITASKLSFPSSKKADECPDRSNIRLTLPPTAEEALAFRPHLKDLPLSMLSSDENISTDDDKISLIRTPREDLQPSQQGDEPCTVPGDAPSVSEGPTWKGSGTVSKEKEDLSISSKHSQVQQLEALVAQNKVIASSLSELKTLSKASESNRESAFIRIMEENVRVMQNIGEKLTSAALPSSSSSLEPDARFTKLSQENQDLKSSLQEQQKRIEILINQNSSLEKKLHVAQHRREGAQEDLGSSSASHTPEAAEDETQSKGEGKAKSSKATKEVSPDESTDSSKGTQREAVGRRLSSHVLPSVPAGQMATSLSPDPSGGSRTQQDATHHSGSEYSRRGSPDVKNETREKRRRSSDVLDSETQKVIDAALRKEKENRSRLLQEAEAEKEVLQERIATLVRENDCLAARLQEVVSVSRNLSGHMHSVKDQLERVEAEKDNLHRKVKSLEDGREDSSLVLSDSIGSSSLTQRLKERIRSLQEEVERGWQEAHQRTVERDKAVAERESLEYTSSIAINTARREAESLREQLASMQEEKDKRWLEQTNLQNELERKCVMAKAAQESQASHLERLVEAERKIKALQNDMKKVEEQLLKEMQARKIAEAELQEAKAKSASSPCGEGEKAASGGEQHWANTVAHLRSQLHQEQLRVRLLEAGEQESSGRVLALQRDIRDALEANQQLQDKYNQLRAAYRAKRAEKTNRKELSQLYTAQLKELGKTSAALEENYKAMLCGLGESIEVTVGLLASHVFLTPCLIHPGPALHLDPEAWFGAQQGRLRWLQSQLRKLCLHNWKTGNLPRTSNLDSSHFDVSWRDSRHSPVAERLPAREEAGQRQIHKSCRILSDLSILDESKSYSSTPVRRRSSASDISLSAASSPTKLGSEVRHSTPKSRPQPGEARAGKSQAPQTPAAPQCSAYLNEAERILTRQQKELSEAKYRQYKALIDSLQQDVDKPAAPSPSIPSSLFTTPERKVAKHSRHVLEENDLDSISSEASFVEGRRSLVSSTPSASPTLAGSSPSTPSLSERDDKDVLTTREGLQTSRNSPEEQSKSEKTSLVRIGDGSSERPPEHEAAVDTKVSSRSSSRTSLVKSPTEGRDGKGDSQATSNLKEDKQSCGLDVDKDRDSWEAEEDLIRMLVHSEGVGVQG